MIQTEKGQRFSLDGTGYSTSSLKEERNCFKDVNQCEIDLNKLSESKLSKSQQCRCWGVAYLTIQFPNVSEFLGPKK